MIVWWCLLHYGKVEIFYFQTNRWSTILFSPIIWPIWLKSDLSLAHLYWFKETSLQATCEWPCVPSCENGNCETVLYATSNPIGKKNLYLSCRYIFMTQSQSHVTYIGVSSDLTREISVKGEQVGDVILIRLSLDIYSLFIDTFCDETHYTRTSLLECFTYGPEQNLHFWC
jgi:hypothetical protein